MLDHISYQGEEEEDEVEEILLTARLLIKINIASTPPH